MFFREVSVKVFGPLFKIELFVFLFLHFKSCLYILDNSSVSDMFFASMGVLRFSKICFAPLHFYERSTLAAVSTNLKKK